MPTQCTQSSSAAIVAEVQQSLAFSLAFAGSCPHTIHTLLDHRLATLLPRAVPGHSFARPPVEACCSEACVSHRQFAVQLILEAPSTLSQVLHPHATLTPLPAGHSTAMQSPPQAHQYSQLCPIQHCMHTAISPAAQRSEHAQRLPATSTGPRSNHPLQAQVPPARTGTPPSRGCPCAGLLIHTCAQQPA